MIAEDHFKIFKLNSTGDLLDEFVYDFGETNDFASRMTLVNGKISVIGQTVPAIGGYLDWLTFQIDLSGNLLWSAQYDYMNNDETPHWITARENGDVYVSGQGGPAYIDFNGSQYLRYVTLKYSNGEMIWRNTSPYQGYIGVANALDNDCGIYVLGETSMTLNHYTDECETIGIENPSRQDEILLYPNPATDKVYLEFNLINTEEMRIIIYNSVGEMIEEIDKSSIHVGFNLVSLSLSNWNNGVYLVSMQGKQTSRSFLLTKM